MPTYSTSAAVQTTYSLETDIPPAGAPWRGRQATDVNDPSCGDLTPLVAGIYEIEVTSNNAGEVWKIDIDGAQRSFTTGASNAATATALKAAVDALKAAGKVLEDKVDTVDAALAVTTITFAEGYVPGNITLVAPGGATTTFSAAYTTEPSVPFDHLPGLWVARATFSNPQVTAVKRPGSLSDLAYGIAVLEGALPLSDNSDAGEALTVWLAGRAMTVARRRDGGIMGLADGEVPVESVGQPVYMVVTGERRGYSRIDNGGAKQVTRGDVVSGYVAAVSQVTRGDVVFNGTDDVGLDVDALPTLFVPSNTSDDQTAEDLRDEWNASAQHAAVATASIDTSGTESYIILTFLDDQAHTVVAYSPATADITGITNTTAAVEGVADALGLVVDSLPTISIVPTTTNDDTNAAALRNAWNASAQHAAVATASIDTSGAESYVVLSFVDYEEHTVASYSPGVGDVTGIEDTTAAVTPTAVLTTSTFLAPADDGERVPVNVQQAA